MKHYGKEIKEFNEMEFDLFITDHYLLKLSTDNRSEGSQRDSYRNDTIQQFLNRRYFLAQTCLGISTTGGFESGQVSMEIRLQIESTVYGLKKFFGDSQKNLLEGEIALRAALSPRKRSPYRPGSGPSPKPKSQRLLIVANPS